MVSLSSPLLASLSTSVWFSRFFFFHYFHFLFFHIFHVFPCLLFFSYFYIFYFFHIFIFFSLFSWVILWRIIFWIFYFIFVSLWKWFIGRVFARNSSIFLSNDLPRSSYPWPDRWVLHDLAQCVWQWLIISFLTHVYIVSRLFLWVIFADYVSWLFCT